MITRLAPQYRLAYVGPFSGTGTIVCLTLTYVNILEASQGTPNATDN